MRKNKMMRIASVLLVAVLLSTCAISGTFAKYTSSQNASDSARVAKWDIDFAGNNAQSKDFVFDLFNTILDTNGLDETDVADDLIAPGTQGSFEINLVNNSEVNAKYSITFEKTLAGVPLTFTYALNEEEVEESSLANLTLDMGDEASIIVHWEWSFNGNDTTDTSLGTAGTAQPSVKATVTVEQVD